MDGGPRVLISGWQPCGCIEVNRSMRPEQSDPDKLRPPIRSLAGRLTSSPLLTYFIKDCEDGSTRGTKSTHLPGPFALWGTRARHFALLGHRVEDVLRGGCRASR